VRISADLIRTNTNFLVLIVFLFLPHFAEEAVAWHLSKIRRDKTLQHTSRMINWGKKGDWNGIYTK
jgi:uncharacterized membrane protein YqjE